MQVTELNDWHDLTYVPLNVDENVVEQEEKQGASAIIQESEDSSLNQGGTGKDISNGQVLGL